MAKDDILRKASQKLGDMVSENEKARLQPEQDRRDFISALSKEVVNTLSPLIAGLTMQSKADSERITRAIASIQVNVPPIPSPQVKLPEINVPTPKVTVNPPQVKVPQINVPKTEINFPDRMDIGLGDYNNKRPLPVMMFDAKGKPQSFSMGAGGGGKADFLTIKDIITSTGASLISGDGKLKVDAAVSVGAVSVSQDYGFGEVGSETIRTVQATDAVSSVYVTGANGTVGVVTIDPDGNPTYASATSGLTDAELRASSVPVAQASGAIWSTEVTSGTITAVTDITNSVATYPLDGDGNYRATLPIEGTLTGITNSTAVQLVNPDGDYAPGGGASGGGTEYDDGEVDATPTGGAVFFLNGVGEVMNVVSSTNALPVTQATSLDKSIDSITSRPVNLRGNLSTAYVSLVDSSEDTLVAASAGNFLDLVWVTAANQSDAAVTIDLRDVSGGSVVATFEVPANATSGIAPAVPYPQGNQGNAWTAQNADSDISNTTVDITALFSQESAS